MPDGPTCFVFRRKRRRGGRTRIAETYTARVGLAGGRSQDIPLHVIDKRVAEQQARELLRRMEQERAGLVRPRAVVEALQRPVAEFIDEFAADLTGAKRVPGYVDTARRRLLKLAEKCGWKTVRDITAESLTRWRRESPDLAPKTQNDYFVLVRSFVGSLRRRRVLVDDPLEFVELVEVRGRRKRDRRALTLQEQDRLRKVAGRHHGVILLALTTGLRRSELDALRWCDLEQVGERTVLRVRASTTKNGKKAPFTLRDDVARALERQRAAGDKPSGVIFPSGCPSMEQFRAYLAAANIAELDGAGRRVDFHALRHTMVTNAKLAGLPGAVVTAYARHSDSRLTDAVYTDASKLPTAEVAAALPRYPSVDAGSGQPIDRGRGGTLEGTLERAASGRFVSRAVEISTRDAMSKVPETAGLGSFLTQLVACGRDLLGNSPTRTRT